MVLKDNLDEIQDILDRGLEVDCINKLQEDHKEMRVEGWVHILTIVGHHLEVLYTRPGQLPDILHLALSKDPKTLSPKSRE